MSRLPPLPHFRDEKTEIQSIYVFVQRLCCRCVNEFDYGGAPHFIGGIRSYVVYVSYFLPTTGNSLSSGPIRPGIWGPGWWASVVFTINAPVPSPSALYHVPVPVFLLFQPVNSQHQIHSSVFQSRDGRCCLCMSMAPD